MQGPLRTNSLHWNSGDVCSEPSFPIVGGRVRVGRGVGDGVSGGFMYWVIGLSTK